MTDSRTPKNAEQEAEFTRKMVLGVLSTLEHKGLLSKGEVDSILRAARQAAYPVTPPRTAGPAAPGTRWVKPGQPTQEMDRNTPVAIPDVRAKGTSEPKPGDPVNPEERRLPMIDMELD
jgi:hypothetical protein